MLPAGRAANRGLGAWESLLVAAMMALPIAAAHPATSSWQAASPSGDLRASFRLDPQGRPVCDVSFRQTPVATATLGLVFAGSEPLQENFKVIASRQASVDETYAIPVGKASSARDHHQELVVTLAEDKPRGRRLDIVIRAFDDGVAFRYVVKELDDSSQFALTEELTRFHFDGDPMAHVLPLNGYTTSYEALYESHPASQLRPDQLIALPMLLRHSDADAQKAVWIGVTEANLREYAGMYLAPVEDGGGDLAARLSPLPGREDGIKVKGTLPLTTPWRVLMIADDPGRLIESNIVFNLNDPSKIADTSWIKLGKTTFPWWNGYVLEGVDFDAGLNTATHKHYIDFCAEQGIEYHSLDGTDVAWYGGPIVPTGPTDVTKAVPEIDLPELLRYARERGVRLRLWMHWRALKPQIDEAFALYEKWGIEGVMVDFMDRDDQEMVAFYHEIAEKAAQHKLTVTLHGCYKPTGMERTWPNVLTFEAALNQEYDKWTPGGVSPAHNLDIAFVRMLAGPVDYHVGAMRNVLPPEFQPRDKAPQVEGTRCHQLAMYVVFENHRPMLVDYPAAYRGQAGLDFLVQVPTNWNETKVLRSEFGKCLVIARRSGETWYVGGMTATESRQLDLTLPFLADSKYEAETWMDDPAAGPTAVTRRSQTVTGATSLRIDVPPSGGFVARLTPQS